MQTLSKKSKSNERKNINIAFLHPDLGIGGAERLIVDAAMALQSVNNNNITIFTSHCDRSHCFEEIKNGLLDVQVYGDFLPTNLNGKFKIVFAFLRQLYLTIKLIITFKIFKYDILILDQLSYCIPLLHLFCWNTKILFYCHFPDKLLASHTSLIRLVYRFLFDSIEEISTSYADQIVVNSNFTKSIVRKTFKLLNNKILDVVYPCVSTDESNFNPSKNSLDLIDKLLNKNSYFLSINRYERKKNIDLAIDSFSSYILKTSNKSQSLIIAGGYDINISENTQYLNELKNKCDRLNLTYIVLDNKELINIDNIDNMKNEKIPNVFFLTSISTDFKNALISKCDLLLYTPTNEHFGIVPLEAMRMGKLVLADNSGGPLETIVDFNNNKNSYTGFTVKSEPFEWEKVLERVKSLSVDDLNNISKRCKDRVKEKFSFIALRNKLVNVINEMQKKQPRHSLQTHIFVTTLSFIIMAYVYKYILS